MRKTNRKQQRTIHFRSTKCGDILCVHDQAAKAYADLLEKDDTVARYAVNVPLENKQYGYIYQTGIRADYFDIGWTTDFLITQQDGSLRVRELVQAQMLGKLAVREQLELSRRYWASKGVSDWKAIMAGLVGGEM